MTKNVKALYEIKRIQQVGLIIGRETLLLNIRAAIAVAAPTTLDP
jgi:hypothetical protein